MSVVVNTLKNNKQHDREVAIQSDPPGKAQPDFGDFDQFAHAYASLAITASFKTTPQDFIVEERLPFGLSGEGEHVWLHIRKAGCNTDWVARMLAKLAGVRLRCIGYAGLKDRHGLTSQWFSVHLPGKEGPDWRLIESSSDEAENDPENSPENSQEQIKVLEIKRHSRKLRRGALKENRFHIRLRSLSSTAGRSMEEMVSLMDNRCQLIAKSGIPNYFGEQRFGRGMGNLASAVELFTNKDVRVPKSIPRHKKSIYLSAARSWIFNRILSQRVMAGSWNRRIVGDVFMLDGKSACFQDDASEDLNDRLSQGELHPTAVLWGEGELMTVAEAAELENRVIDTCPEFREGLREFKVQQMRRALRVVPGDMVWTFEEGVFSLAFNLPAGCYATMVLRELLDLENVH